MNYKKIPYYIALSLLTVGASLILGFLSFGGMFALWPIVSLAAAAFVLSVGYEGEIYYQNIKGALKKLIKKDHIERELGKEYLLKHFPDTSDENCPQFFKDYEAQLKLSHEFGHKRLDAASLARQKQVDKTLSDMEKWYASKLFARQQQPDATNYDKEVADWVAHPDNHAHKFKAKARKHRIAFNVAKGFAILAGLFMCVGSTYLLVGAFAVIPLMAAIPYVILPAIIIPMAIIAGAAYSMLIYNAITDMIANDTVRKWFFQIRKDWNNGDKAHAVFIAVTSILLGALAITLTICTAGTWWTIAKTARPLFTWMSKMPAFIMGVINPIIIGISSIIFNWQNTSETLSMIDKAARPHHAREQKQPNFFVRTAHAIKNGFRHLRARENWLQIFNPFRIILKVSMIPLRLIFFIGHLISMGVGDDRVPGIPETLAAILGTTSEIFEDAHYFFDLAGSDHHDHGPQHHKHHHDDDHEQHHEHEHHHEQEHHHEHVHQHVHHSHATTEAHEDAHYFFDLAGSGHHGHGPQHHHHDDHEQHHEHEHHHEQEPLHGHVHHHAHQSHTREDQLKERLSKEHGHSHNNDLPTRFLNLVFLPVYFASASWNYFTSKLNTDPRKPVSFKRSWEKQWGLTKEKSVEPESLAPTSADWQREHAIYRIDRHIDKQLQNPAGGKSVANDKIANLTNLQRELRQLNTAEDPHGLNNRLTDERDNQIYKQHRFFSRNHHAKPTSTEEFINGLEQCVAPNAGVR